MIRLMHQLSLRVRWITITSTRNSYWVQRNSPVSVCDGTHVMWSQSTIQFWLSLCDD
jgi:hypothetical protein